MTGSPHKAVARSSPEGEAGPFATGPVAPVAAAELDRHKMAAARLWAAKRFPYLATALFATTVMASPGLEGVAADASWRLYVDPDLADRWTVEELGALLIHHTGHLVRDHAGRAETMGVTEISAERWSLAADAELNDDLDEAGITMPCDNVMPEDLGYARGRLAEEYYQLRTMLRDPRKDDEDGGAGPENDPPPEAPDHGSAVHGQPRPWEDPLPGSPGGIGTHERTLLRAQVASDILSELRAGQADIPGSWRRWAEALLAPTVDWRKALAAEVRRGVNSVAGCVDYTYRRPSRRATASPDVILPALEKPVPEVAVVCDTSASMGDRELGRVLAEVEGLLASIGLRSGGVRVLAVDTAVQTVRRVSSARQVELVGGGGTDMTLGIDAAAALRPRPSVLVVLTDGLTPWPTAPPRGLRVVIGLIGSPDGRSSPSPSIPAWARVVRIDDLSDQRLPSGVD